MLDGGGGFGFDGIGDGEEGGELVVDGEEDGGFGLGGEVLELGGCGGEVDVVGGHELLVAEEDILVVDGGLDAVAGEGEEVGGL